MKTMSTILEIMVGRQLTQHRRSMEEAQTNMDYLADLPRDTAFRLLSAEPLGPVPDGIGWYYRGIIRYEPKGYMSQDRINKDRVEILRRVQEACAHARWGRFPWRLEDNEPQVPVVTQTPPSLSSQNSSVLQEADHASGPLPFLPPEGSIKEVSEKLALISETSHLMILFLLKAGEMNVTEICNALGSQSQPSVSQKLSKLRLGRLVVDRREGQHKYYNLTDEGHELVDFAGRLIA